METVNIHSAKTNFSKLVEMVGSGKEVLIAKAGKPVAKLVPFKGARTPRKKGLLKGKIRIGRHFDKPLPASLLAAFEGKRAR